MKLLITLSIIAFLTAATAQANSSTLVHLPRSPDHYDTVTLTSMMNTHGLKVIIKNGSSEDEPNQIVWKSNCSNLDLNCSAKVKKDVAVAALSLMSAGVRLYSIVESDEKLQSNESNTIQVIANPEVQPEKIIQPEEIVAEYLQK